MTRTILSLAIAALLGAGARTAAADCSIDVPGTVMTYWPNAHNSQVNANDRRCNYFGAYAECNLQGWLFTPTLAVGQGNLPAVI